MGKLFEQILYKRKIHKLLTYKNVAEISLVTHQKNMNENYNHI